MNDFDVLVPTGKLEPALTALRDWLDAGGLPNGRGFSRAAAGLYHSWGFRDESTRGELDLHWHASADSCQRDADQAFWSAIAAFRGRRTGDEDAVHDRSAVEHPGSRIREPRSGNPVGGRCGDVAPQQTRAPLVLELASPRPRAVSVDGRQLSSLSATIRRALMLRDLVRALHLIPRRRRWQWVVLIPLALAAAALESMGAGVVLTLGTIVAEPARAVSLPVVSRIAAWLPRAAPQDLIITATAGVVVFYIARGLLLTLFAWVQETVVQRTASEVARRLLAAYLAAPYVFHLRRNSARLIQAAGHSVEAVYSSGLGAAVNFVTEALTLVGLIAVLAFAAPLATLVSVATIGLVLLGPLFVTRHLAVRHGADVKRLQEALLQDLQQSLASFKEVRVMGAERHFLSAFSAHRDRLASVRKRQGTLTTVVRVFVESTFVVAILMAVILVTARGASGGSLIGLMALYAYAGFRVVPSANRLILNFAVFQGSRPHVEGLWSDFSLLERLTASGRHAASTEPLPFADRIDLQSVSYTYEDGRGPALNDVSLTIRRGESLGIVGLTGAGKSTLIDILLGLLDPLAGQVLVDGRDIRADVGLWQRRIGYVPQGFALLDDTLRRNVAFGRPDPEINDADVEAALRLAHLGETVASLPQGLDTRLGERGVRLSGGERQRVAIARALYHTPDVLVFDEATSSLDQQTEQAIIRAIDELRGVKTLVVVAHRLSTVRGCQRLVFLEDGRITGEGSYDELLERHVAFGGMVSAGVG